MNTKMSTEPSNDEILPRHLPFYKSIRIFI